MKNLEQYREEGESPMQGEDSPKPRKRNHKGLIILGSVAGIIAIAAVGLLIWHNQPSFCNAICHTPMDPYGDTYFQEVGVAGVDKWGNEVESTSGMMCVTHRAAGLGCMDCHVPTLSEQVGEGIAWVTGNYEVVGNSTYPAGVLTERDLTQLVAARGLDSGDDFCLNPDCHDTDRAGLISLSMEVSRVRNPHSMPHQDYECSDCHKAHRSSVNQCSGCHADAPIPEGWLTVSEEKKLEAVAK